MVCVHSDVGKSLGRNWFEVDALQERGGSVSCGYWDTEWTVGGMECHPLEDEEFSVGHHVLYSPRNLISVQWGLFPSKYSGRRVSFTFTAICCWNLSKTGAVLPPSGLQGRSFIAHKMYSQKRKDFSIRYTYMILLINLTSCLYVCVFALYSVYWQDGTEP